MTNLSTTIGLRITLYRLWTAISWQCDSSLQCARRVSNMLTPSLDLEVIKQYVRPPITGAITYIFCMAAREYL